MRTAIWAAATLPLLGLACGQKDPPGTDSDAGASTGSYYPFVDGTRYRYLHSRGGWLETLTIAAVEGESDMFEQIQTGDPDGESSTSLLLHDEGAILRVAEDQLLNDELVYSTAYDPGFLRFDAAWTDEDAGFSETRRYQRTETEAGQAAKDPQPRAHVFTVESLSETLVLPAGTFRNCIRIRRERDLSDPDIAAAMTTQDEQEKLFWFAPGVGKVREENLINGSTEELVDYEIPEE